ncbi:MAG: ATP phosphoribosyltransferase regulatory subunit [Solirubrobacterales bacterium]
MLAELGTVDSAAGRSSAARLGAVAEALGSEGLDAEIVFDLGMARDPDYYSGEVYEVYSKRLGRSMGGGGRYDGLLEQFGVELPAVGFSLSLERLHAALIEGSVAP